MQIWPCYLSQCILGRPDYLLWYYTTTSCYLSQCILGRPDYLLWYYTTTSCYLSQCILGRPDYLLWYYTTTSCYLSQCILGRPDYLLWYYTTTSCYLSQCILGRPDYLLCNTLPHHVTCHNAFWEGLITSSVIHYHIMLPVTMHSGKTWIPPLILSCSNQFSLLIVKWMAYESCVIKREKKIFQKHNNHHELRYQGKNYWQTGIWILLEFDAVLLIFNSLSVRPFS